MSGTTFITRARVRRTMADEWHSLPADDVLRRLDASPLGLNASDAARRLARIGPNELVRTARISPWRILLAQFVDVLVIVLIIAAIISAVLGTLQGELADLYDAILILAVVKAIEPLPRDSFVGDRKNMVFMGTAVEGGRGKAVVVETGMATELGKIAGLVQQETKEETPLQKQLDRLGRQIGIAILSAAALIFGIGVLRDPRHIELMFLTAVGLAVAAIPEGLPAIVTISLALGLQRMIRRGALIRKLPAVEALGAASVICSDKTGPLTKGEMNVRVVGAGTREYEVIGEGSDRSGLVRADGQVADLEARPGLQRVLECGVLCNDAVLKREGNRWVVEGDPTEGALLVAARRARMDPDAIRAKWPRVA